MRSAIVTALVLVVSCSNAEATQPYCPPNPSKVCREYFKQQEALKQGLAEIPADPAPTVKPKQKIPLRIKQVWTAHGPRFKFAELTNLTNEWIMDRMSKDPDFEVVEIKTAADVGWLTITVVYDTVIYVEVP